MAPVYRRYCDVYWQLKASHNYVLKFRSKLNVAPEKRLDIRTVVAYLLLRFIITVSYGRGIRKGTQGSLLAWRAASLLLGRLLLLY